MAEATLEATNEVVKAQAQKRAAPIVPERSVFGHAVASHVPEATLVMSRLTARAGPAGATNSMSRSRIAIVLYTVILVLAFVFMGLLRLSSGRGVEFSPATEHLRTLNWFDIQFWLYWGFVVNKTGKNNSRYNYPRWRMLKVH